MNKVYLILGGNIGNRVYNINKATKLLSGKCRIIKKSSVYESEAWGFNTTKFFLNQVIYVDTKLSCLELLQFINDIENKLHRKRDNLNKYSSRTIDIDIQLLLFNSLVAYIRRVVLGFQTRQNAFNHFEEHLHLLFT